MAYIVFIMVEIKIDGSEFLLASNSSIVPVSELNENIVSKEHFTLDSFSTEFITLVRVNVEQDHQLFLMKSLKSQELLFCTFS
ncbi:hypothetical protein QNH98_17295 [Myroides sp. mNGS23_01]|nr:hypothetical protein [Myroides sp. mNGS23_01]WHT38721.1 hypothetical protein QNH98_17295 [Myroides sp. mNGS23_01]